MVMMISPPPPELGVSSCVPVSYATGGGIRPRPLATERYSAIGYGSASNPGFRPVARFEYTVWRPNLAGDQAALVERSTADRTLIDLIAGGYRWHECLPPRGWHGATAVDCPAASVDDDPVTLVRCFEGQNVGCGSLPSVDGGATPSGAVPGGQFVDSRRWEGVHMTRQRVDGEARADESFWWHGAQGCGWVLSSDSLSGHRSRPANEPSAEVLGPRTIASRSYPMPTQRPARGRLLPLPWSRRQCAPGVTSGDFATVSAGGDSSNPGRARGRRPDHHGKRFSCRLPFPKQIRNRPKRTRRWNAVFAAHLQGRSYSGIATTLGISSVKVESDIDLGRIALRRMIGGPVPLEGLEALVSRRGVPLALLQEPNQSTQLEKEKTR